MIQSGGKWKKWFHEVVIKIWIDCFAEPDMDTDINIACSDTICLRCDNLVTNKWMSLYSWNRSRYKCLGLHRVEMWTTQNKTYEVHACWCAYTGHDFILIVDQLSPVIIKSDCLVSIWIWRDVYILVKLIQGQVVITKTSTTTTHIVESTNVSF